MQANELRIGNWINYKSQDIQVASLVFDNSADRNHKELTDNIKPIPLTEQWLERFGFKISYDKHWYDKGANRGDILSVNIKTNECLLGSKINWAHPRTVYYVHQLQNLYFALTGEELTLKEIPVEVKK